MFLQNGLSVLTLNKNANSKYYFLRSHLARGPRLPRSDDISIDTYVCMYECYFRDYTYAKCKPAKQR